MFDRPAFKNERLDRRGHPLRPGRCHFDRARKDEGGMGGDEPAHVAKRNRSGGQLRAQRFAGLFVCKQRVTLATPFFVERVGDRGDRGWFLQHDRGVGRQIIKNGRASRERIFPRGYREPVERRVAALRFDRKVAQRFDRVAEELDAHGRVGGCGKKVDDAAAHRVLADRADHVAARVAKVEEPLLKLLETGRRAGTQVKP